MKRKNIKERLIRERDIFKVNSDFVDEEKRGEMEVIDGNVMEINNGEEDKMKMFIWNKILLRLGFEVREN
jgi:hypothetical protein